MEHPDRLTLERVAGRLRLPRAGQALCTGWDAAFAAPPAQALPFLESGYIAWAAREVELTEEMIGALVAFAARIAGDEDVVAFFWYCRHRVLHDHTLVLSWEEQWPPLDDYLGRDAGLLNVLVMLSAVPEMKETYRRLGIPAEIVRDTVADLKLWMETDLYYQRHQRWGITPWIARWLCKHWQGKVFRLKRLQFSAGKFEGRLRAYRRRGGRELIAISEPGIRYCPDGKAWGGSCCGDVSDAWASVLEMTADAVVGNPIAPDGRARRQTRRLPLEEWESVLAPGDGMLTFHIPAGGPLTFEDCGESFRKALEVFPHYLPEVRFRGFTTGSWLLDPCFEDLLPPESNILRLQHEAYLYPGIQGYNEQVYQRVFGWGVTDPKDAPRRTSLQKAIAQYLEAGGHFHGGYCFLLKEDFDWGSKVYRTQWQDGRSVI